MSILDSGKNFLLDKSGLQQHFDENEVLRAAANEGIISNELYNKMGGFNFKENVPFAGDFGTGLGSFTYNVAQSVLGNQPISEIPGDVARNYMGAAVGLTKDEKDLYDSILGQRESTLTDSLVNIPSNIKNTLGDLIFTPTSADADKPPSPPNPELLNQFDNITNTGVAGINIDELDDDRSTLLDRKDGILNNVDLGKLLSFAEILGPTNLRKALAGTRLGSTVSNLFQGGRDRPNFQYRTPGYTGQLIASDQYDPKTGLNRFDRAKTLFGQSRSLKEYFEKKKALANAKRLGRIPTAPSGDDSGDGGGVKDSGGPTGGYTYDSGGREGFGYGL